MLRFTIGDLLWMMVVVGLGAGWWIDSAGKEWNMATLNRVCQEQKNEIAERIEWHKHELEAAGIEARILRAQAHGWTEGMNELNPSKEQVEKVRERHDKVVLAEMERIQKEGILEKYKSPKEWKFGDQVFK